MNTELIKQACRDSIEKSKPFPEVVAMLDEAGVERYHADLNQRQNTYYDAAGHAFTNRLKDVELTGETPLHGDLSRVREAIRLSQQNAHTYREFLQKIYSAGFPVYDVYLTGRQAVYTDRCGERHVEKFPSQN
jgi:uncharacterized protein YbcV (DUF1398 family)